MLRRKFSSRVKQQMEKSQKEYYLNEQMNAIQKELGNKDDGKSDIGEMEDKLASKAKVMPQEAREKSRERNQETKVNVPLCQQSLQLFETMLTGC
jgi:ATP-dependent Lon protease